MKILIATFGFFPYSFGGTENYVRDQVSVFKKQNHDVVIFSSLNALPENSELFYHDNYIKVIQYVHEGTVVYGVLLDIKETWQLYDLNNDYLLKSYSALIKKAGLNDIDVLQLNCFTSVVNLNLYNALKLENTSLKLIYCVHTAFFCVKGTLIHTKTEELCTVKINTKDCFTCYYTGLNYRNSKVITAMMGLYKVPFLGPLVVENTAKFSLTKKLISSIHKLLSIADGFVVYSELYKNVLINQGVPSSKINVNRHGITSDFTLSNNQIMKEQNTFMYSGRLLKLKGAETVFKAWLALSDNTNRRLYIACPNTKSNDIEVDLFSKMQLRNDVTWVEAPSKTELIEIYKKVQCVLIPSEAIEIGPLVFHEAILAKCNIITSNNSGSLELTQYFNCSEAIKVFDMKNDNMLSLAIKGFKYFEFDLDSKVKNIENHFSSLLTYFQSEQ